MGAEIDDIKRQLEREQRIRRTLGVVGLLTVLALTAAGMTYLGFTVASLVRQFDEWVNFVSHFFAPTFVDLTSYTRANGIGGLRAIWVTVTRPWTVVTSIAEAPVGSGVVLIPAALATIIVGFTGTVLGFPLALLFGILGSERVTPFPFNFAFRGTMSAIRAVPALIWVLIYIPVFGITPMSGVLAIATDTIGNLGRLFTDELEEIDDGPIEAIRSTGASRPQEVLFGMLSQVSNSFIAWTLYVLEINTRIAISLGVTSVGGLGMYIQLKLGTGKPNFAAAGLIMVVFIVITVELLSSRVRARLRPDEHESKSIVDAISDLTDGSKWLGTDTERP